MMLPTKVSLLYLEYFFFKKNFKPNLKNILFILELLPELMATEPRLDVAVEKVIVVDNIPKVGSDKKDKLKTILGKMLVNYGKVINEFYPEDENQVLKGYFFLNLKFFAQKSKKNSSNTLNTCQNFNVCILIN
jgi:hypothetical protein